MKIETPEACLVAREIMVFVKDRRPKVFMHIITTLDISEDYAEAVIRALTKACPRPAKG